MPKRARTSPNSPSFLAGLGLVFLGLYLFLSLASYSPKSVPSWAPIISTFSHYASAPINLGGPLGTLLAGYSLFFLGASAYLLAMTSVGYGIAKWCVPGYRLRDKVGWGLLMVLIGACLIQIQPWFLGDWKTELRIEGPGGFLGLWIGQKAVHSVLGTASVFLMLGLYIGSLSFAISSHPMRDSVRAWKSFLAWREARRAARLAALDEERRIEEERKALEKKAEKLTRKLKKQGVEIPEPDEAAPVQEELDLPEPEIIDATAPSAKKPKLSELQNSKPAKDSFPPGLLDVHLENYVMPGPDLLDAQDESDREPLDREELKNIQMLIIDTLAQFGIKAAPGTITKGPTITRYEVYPDVGVRVDKIVALERDIARATRAERINILAPIPGKDTVGIEIANSKKVKVTLRELFEKDAWRESTAKLPLALGMDVYGHTIIGDLAKMPHLLVAGTTGSGKSVCINSIIASLLFQFTPEQLRFIMIDPKVVEMQTYNDLPHLVVPVVTDPKKTVAALKWVVNEMEKRYRIFAKEGVRNFDGFNNRVRPDKSAPVEQELQFEEEEEEEVDEDAIEEIASALESGDLIPEADEEELEIEEEKIPDRFPYIVVLIDELADLMQTAPADVEMCIARIAQKARAAGIHLIIATQTPRADVVTGIIKANIPSRIAFQVSSQLDSRVILDTKGAEKLVGKGDMLYLPPGSAKLERSQGAFVTDAEVERIIDHCAAQGAPKFETDIQASINSADNEDEEDVSEADEELIMKCIEVVRQEQKASTSLLQRRLRLGYTRAARMVDILEQRGIVGPGEGAKAREVYLK